jgi:hypothetical protein
MSFLSHPVAMICSRPATSPAPTRDVIILWFDDWLPRLLVFFFAFRLQNTPCHVRQGRTLLKTKEGFICFTCYWRGTRIPMHAFVSKQEPSATHPIICHIMTQTNHPHKGKSLRSLGLDGFENNTIPVVVPQLPHPGPIRHVPVGGAKPHNVSIRISPLQSLLSFQSLHYRMLVTLPFFYNHKCQIIKGSSIFCPKVWYSQIT